VSSPGLTRPTAHSRGSATSALPAIARGEEWQWTLRLKADPENLVGAIGLKKHETDNRGFWIGREWQRRGLMTEAADTVTDYWFDTLKFPVLRVPKAIANTDSRRISERQGMRVVATEDRDYVSGRLPAEIWEITAAEWNARGCGTEPAPSQLRAGSRWTFAAVRAHGCAHLRVTSVLYGGDGGSRRGRRRVPNLHTVTRIVLS
jgi:hypothetical protein